MKETSKQAEESLKKQVNSLYDLMKTENLEELEIKETDFYLLIKRKGKSSPQTVVVQQQQQQTAAAPAAEAPVLEPCGETVKSPIIGVYYQSPSPSSPAFVKEGDVVPQGKTLCIVEAMKVMNEIKAEYRLKVLKILVENGKPIVSGQDLFLVEKA